MADSPASTGNVAYVNLAADDLRARFSRCCQTADYVAGLLSCHALDPEQLQARASGCLQELLEVGRRHARPGSSLEVRVVREAGNLVIHVDFMPREPEALAARVAALDLPAEDAAHRYRQGFLDPAAPLGDVAGLLEQVALHGIPVRCSTAPERLVLQAHVATA